MPQPTTKITEPTRQAALKQPLKPSMIVTTSRAIWCQFLQPRGCNPSTGRRWSLVRHELGDARTMSVAGGP
jgi:hypothetical protein